MVNLLITAGADVNAVDKQNLTVMVRAKKSAHEKLLKSWKWQGQKWLHKSRLRRLQLKKMMKPSQQDNRKTNNNQRFNELLG